MAESHEGLCGIHASTEWTIQKVLLDGFWWPTLQEDVLNYVNHCPKCVEQPPVPHATLYAIMRTQDWASYIVEYLTKGHIDPDKPKHRKMQIEIEARDYTLIKGQLYKMGKDGNLQLCIPKEKRHEILTHTHAGIGGGHVLGPTTAKTILWSGLWWPTLFLNGNEHVRRCDECQRTKPPIHRDEMPLRPILATRAFSKRGLTRRTI